MKSTRKKIDYDMRRKISNQIHYEFVTYDIRCKTIKGIHIPFIYSIKTQISDKMWNEV